MSTTQGEWSGWLKSLSFEWTYKYRADFHPPININGSASQRPTNIYGSTSSGHNQGPSQYMIVDRPRKYFGPDAKICCAKILFAVVATVVVGSIFITFQWVWKTYMAAFMCSKPGNGDPGVMYSFSFDPQNYSNVNLRMHESVFGRISITEDDSEDVRDVKVIFHVKTSVPHVLKDIKPYISLLPHATAALDGLQIQSSTADIWLDLSSIAAPTRGQLHQWRCVRVDVEIVYPTFGRLQLDSLTIQAFTSNFVVNLPTITFRKLSLISSGRGEVELIGVASLRSTELKVDYGKITGRLSTQENVRAKVALGGEGIVLDIDRNDARVAESSALLKEKGANEQKDAQDGSSEREMQLQRDQPRGLDISAQTMGGGAVHVRVFSPVPYQGHFDLVHNWGWVRFRRSNEDIPYKFTLNGWTRLTGFIAEDGEEPVSLLPNIALGAVYSGDVSLELIS
ncbi:hypothetical protein EDD11_001051 [Mortierella claussenii]|nr:hypothetical protein EDD11_001051 [Mortierella claussenii]